MRIFVYVSRPLGSDQESQRILLSFRSPFTISNCTLIQQIVLVLARTSSGRVSGTSRELVLGLCTLYRENGAHRTYTTSDVLDLFQLYDAVCWKEGYRSRAKMQVTLMQGRSTRSNTHKRSNGFFIGMFVWYSAKVEFLLSPRELCCLFESDFSGKLCACHMDTCKIETPSPPPHPGWTWHRNGHTETHRPWVWLLWPAWICMCGHCGLTFLGEEVQGWSRSVWARAEVHWHTVVNDASGKIEEWQEVLGEASVPWSACCGQWCTNDNLVQQAAFSYFHIITLTISPGKPRHPLSILPPTQNSDRQTCEHTLRSPQATFTLKYLSSGKVL